MPRALLVATDLRNAARHAAQRAAIRARDIEAGCTPASSRSRARCASPASTIRSRRADLAMLGDHGVGRTDDLLLGSVTQQVMGQVRSDVRLAVG